MSAEKPHDTNDEADELFAQSPEFKRLARLGKALFAVSKKELDEQLEAYESPSEKRKHKAEATE